MEARKRGIRIRHALNWGEFRVPGTRYRVDGYHKPSNTVFEFYGDDFHGRVLYCGGKHPFKHNVTVAQLLEKTKKREAELRALGYNLVVMWESDYEKLKKESG